METEIWKALPGVIGVEVSTLGNVRTLDKLISSEKMTRFTKGHVLKRCNDKDGYLSVRIPIDGKRATKRVHRLVAQTFIKNTDNLPEVNHKNCDRSDNRVINLEWCSHSYNMKYREKFGISNTESQGNPLFAINLDTLEVLHFRSQNEASRVLGVFQANIFKVIKGSRNQAGGFWFVNDDDKATDAINNKLHKIRKGDSHANTKRVRNRG